MLSFPADAKNIWSRAEADFIETALAIFAHQAAENQLYKAYLSALRIDPLSVRSLLDIPFLPISFFKSHEVVSGAKNSEKIFESSGTSGMQPSKHFVSDVQLYDDVALRIFENRFGAVRHLRLPALLPSYLERGNSSLVHMAQMLMRHTAYRKEDFYLNDFEALQKLLQTCLAEKQPVLLLGVTFALLDFAEAFPFDGTGLWVLETGGMKGRKQAWTRAQVHEYLKSRWPGVQVFSEYGMTELLSQAYTDGSEIFTPPPTMRVFVREINDPLNSMTQGRGALNIIDLANVNSCAFIATEDVGEVLPDGRFTVSGRMDFAALRGCSLMAL